MKQTKNKKLRILAIGAVTFFSLCANILATIAWFTANRNTENENDYFAVENEGDAVIESINLYKFKYKEIPYGTGDDQIVVIDYLNPSTGEVKKYGFNQTEEKFGETVTDPNTLEEEFVPVTVMNVYDPIEKVIKQNLFNLKELNCNVVYEIVLSSTSFTNCDLNVVANWLSSKTKQSGEIFLTDCVDFDLYFESDLSNDNPNFSMVDPQTSETISKLYYPSYIDKSVSLSANEDVYYKISYLSSIANSHPHFYGSNVKPNSISLVNGTPLSKSFDNQGKLKLFVNVNYCPAQLERYAKDIYRSDIKAVYDYSLSFQITSGGNS